MSAFQVCARTLYLRIIYSFKDFSFSETTQMIASDPQ